MAVFTPESLVLRGVSVLGDGQAVGLRLGSHEAIPQAKAIPFSMRHPSPGCLGTETVTGRRLFPADNPAGNEAAVWAGRPGSRAGVLVRRSPAIIAGRTVVYRWSPAVGGLAFTAATRLGPQWAKRVATVADETSRRPLSRDAFAFQPSEGSERFPERPASHEPPAPRTLAAASTRGIGGR